MGSVQDVVLPIREKVETVEGEEMANAYGNSLLSQFTLDLSYRNLNHGKFISSMFLGDQQGN
jgi:hypothetical protein